MPRKKLSGATNWVDPDDAPALTPEHFQRAEVYEGERLVRRGRPPVGGEPKVAVKLRLPRHVLDAYKAGGPGWQTRISETLEASVAGRPQAPAREAAIPTDQEPGAGRRG